jgi:ATP-dependent DNA ligase
MGTMAPAGNAKSRTGITPCGLIRDCWFPSSVAVPELLAEIEYRAKSAEGKVRHPFFKGLREDL